MLKPLSTKAFQKMTGGMERKVTQRVRYQESPDNHEEPLANVPNLGTSLLVRPNPEFSPTKPRL